MGAAGREVRAKFLKTLLLYLVALIVLQLIGIAYILHEPSLHRGIPLAIFLGTILPVILALIFIKFIKIP